MWRWSVPSSHPKAKCDSKLCGIQICPSDIETDVDLLVAAAADAGGSQWPHIRAEVCNPRPPDHTQTDSLHMLLWTLSPSRLGIHSFRKSNGCCISNMTH
mmetsp:Transcript_72664/g.173190  ORF Transcript_72664/g.173190 Transcript_72664/m.173190 type:complete len:100 (-) Transcript_72664:102-401(-)